MRAGWKMRSNPDARRFRALVRNCYREHGRKQLPWRPPALKLRKGGVARDPYRVLVSEVMLQQTQASRVTVFYPRFVKRFPTLRDLAKAPVREVLKAWQGLGYNRRALALKRAAEEVLTNHGGKLPRDPVALEKLPGIGRATAGAIAAFAFNIPTAFTETNIRRVFIHYFFPRAKKVSEEKILKLVEKTLPKENPRPVRGRPPRGGRSRRPKDGVTSNGAREWYYALMDYGSWLATQVENPNRRHAAYRRPPPFKGSSRELRGKILKLALAEGTVPARRAARVLSVPLAKAKGTLAALRKEGFL